MKSIAFFDIDNTIVNGQSQLFLIKYLFRKKQIGLCFIIKVYFWFLLYKFNIVKNPRPIMEYSFNMIKNKTLSEVDEMLREFVNSELSKKFNIKVLDLINWHRTKNHYIVIVSNIFYPLAEAIAQKLNIQSVIATRLDAVGGKYNGKIVGDIIYGKNKAENAKRLLEDKSLQESFCYADHISDLPLLKLVSCPVAVNPDKELFKIARNNNWQIIRG